MAVTNITVQLVLYERGPVVWQLENLHEATARGIMYGTFYSLREDRNRYNYIIYHFTDPKHKDLYRYNTYLNGVEMQYNMINAYYNTDKYWLMLRSYDDFEERRITSTQYPDRYIQGLLTVLKYYNEDISEVLISQPYKDKIYYDVQGLTLPQRFIYNV